MNQSNIDALNTLSSAVEQANGNSARIKESLTHVAEVVKNTNDTLKGMKDAPRGD